AEKVPAHAIAVGARVEYGEEVAHGDLGQRRTVRDHVARVGGASADVCGERVGQALRDGADAAVCAVDGRAREVRGGGVDADVAPTAPLLDRAYAGQEDARAG